MRLLFTVCLLICCFIGKGSAMDTGFDLPEPVRQRVLDGIEANRKSDAQLRVTRNGRPISGARVEVKQASHAFLFGCAFPNWDIAKSQPNPEDWQKFEAHFLSLFNYLTTENMIKWNFLERKEGNPDYTMTDNMAAWALRNNIKVKGHCLTWGIHESYLGFPAWLKEKSREEVSANLERHIRDTVTRYRGRIDIWDVVNEPLHCHWFRDNMGPDYAAKSFIWARQANPKATLLINEYNLQFHDKARLLVEYVEELQSAGATVDGIGEQVHDFPHIASPEAILAMFDTLGSKGAEVHLTELTMPSDGTPVKSTFVEGNWTPELQGKYYRYLFTLGFSHPDVRAITLWALWDGASWLNQGGIITRDWLPKPAYRELDSLINREWRTCESGVTGTDGKYSFRGFHGGYQVTVRYGVEARTFPVRVEANQPNRITLQF